MNDSRLDSLGWVVRNAAEDRSGSQRRMLAPLRTHASDTAHPRPSAYSRLCKYRTVSSKAQDAEELGIVTDVQLRDCSRALLEFSKELSDSALYNGGA